MAPDPCKRDPVHYTKLDVFERRIISSIKFVAAYECPQHNPNLLCRCPAALESLSPRTKELFIYIHFVQAWEQHLLLNDAAFIFKDEDDAIKLFKILNRKQSAQEFVVAFINRTFAAPAMLAPASLLDDTIEAMIDFWEDRAAAWRANYENKTAARADLQACLPSYMSSRLYGDLSKRDEDFALKLGQGLLIAQRFSINLKMGKSQHTCTIFLMPLLPELRDGVMYVRHRLLGMRLCHEECARYQPVVKQVSIEGFRAKCRGGRSSLDVNIDTSSGESSQKRVEFRFTDPVEGAH